MFSSRCSCFVLCLILLAGCGKEQPALPPLPDDGVILAFGDSLTYGSGVDGRNHYPAILAELTNREVINEGVPGEVSRDGLARLPMLLDDYRPHLLLLIHGGNDMLRKIPPEETEANLKAMVALARERGIAVAMLGVPQPGLRLKSADIYQAVAEEAGIPFDDKTLAKVLSDSQLKSDPIHPNAAGYRVMAQAVLDLLRESGGLR